jgi:hypothetical protein
MTNARHEEWYYAADREQHLQRYVRSRETHVQYFRVMGSGPALELYNFLHYYLS